METVFGHWKPEIGEFFVSRGADVETDYPLANALIWRIRPGLGFFKRYQDQFPSLQEQINVALRHHSYEGNLKWVSLLLWAGADPWAGGPKDVGEEADPEEEDYNAFQWAAFRGHSEIFKLKKIQLDPNRPESRKIFAEACYSGSDKILRLLLEKGFSPGDLENSGSRLIGLLISRMSWNRDWNHWSNSREKKNIDSSYARGQMEMLHLLARHGVKWKPGDESEIKSIRRDLLKLTPDYTVELIWILTGYSAARPEDMEELIKVPSMRKHIANHFSRINGLIQNLRSTAASYKM